MSRLRASSTSATPSLTPAISAISRVAGGAGVNEIKTFDQDLHAVAGVRPTEQDQ